MRDSCAIAKNVTLFAMTTIAALFVSTSHGLLLPPDWNAKPSQMMELSSNVPSKVSPKKETPSHLEAATVRLQPDKILKAEMPKVGASKSLVFDQITSPEGYVIQWMASSSKSALEALQQRHHFLENAQIASYQQRGKWWYILIEGPYQNKMSAQAIMQPATDELLYPMTRSMTSLAALNVVLLPNETALPTNYTALPNEPDREALKGSPSVHTVTKTSYTDDLSNGYVIEWRTADDIAELERLIENYPILQQAQVIQYEDQNKRRYSLVSTPFVTRAEALDQMVTPQWIMMSSRLSPKVHFVNDLPAIQQIDPLMKHVAFLQ